MKRSASDSDNEVFYEESDLTKVGSPSQSCYRSDRKRRRGVIEKRRRDRINNSLTELRRLVPAAFEKQDSAKLEKAEILQMTVDHLKSLHAKGVAGYNLDTAVLAMDYRTVGFRECAAEVARYLISVEGLDIQDPMRLRLMSHLQCYCTQREAAARTSLQNTTWNHHHHHHMGSNPAQPVQYNADMVQQHPSQIEPLAAGATNTPSLASMYMDSNRGSHGAALSDGGNGLGMPAMRLPPSVGTVASQVPGASSASSAPQMAPPPSMIAGLPSVHGQFIGVNPVAVLSPNSFYYGPSSHQNVKPYRPWGSEVVY